MYRKQLNSVIDKIIQTDSAEIEEVKPELIDDYKKLNDKCDDVIFKIKTRKSKKEK